MEVNTLILGGEGYTGSALKNSISNSRSFDIVNNSNYDTLTAQDLSLYKNIILLAGHSSFAQCVNDPQLAWSNNVDNFSKLLTKLKSDQLLIYASSASVYGSQKNPCTEETQLTPAQEVYDKSKQAIEELAQTAECKTIGLRLGTLAGVHTSNLIRRDLLINALTLDAVEKKYLTCSNYNNYRSILGMRDFCRAIGIMITTEPQNQHQIFNLGSINGTIKYFAESVSAELSVPINYIEEVTNTYSFELDCRKFCSVYGFHFEDTVEKLIQDVKQNKVPQVKRI